jgi:TonB-linked SusC/RagA family outer membrane protein
MNVPRLGMLLGGAWVALVAAGVDQAAAQNAAVITGTVQSQRGDPLGGATVVVNNTNFGASTAPNGTYTITVSASAVRGQEVTLTARYLGFKPITRTITLTVGTQEQNFSLAPDPLRLDELVVTGVSEATSTKKLTFAVGKVSEDQLQEVPGSTALNALQGKVAGVRIVNATGEPGNAPNIRLRGATSIGGRQDPLIIVDGVITRATLADIAGEDIERIEVVKGAAGSSLYGSDAANGVINIFTKRGANLADGKLQVVARVEGGANFLPRRIPTSGAHEFEINADGTYKRNAQGSRVPKPDNIADNPYPVNFNQQDLLINSGNFWKAYANVAQRRGNTNFSASYQKERNEGIIFGLNGYERDNYRLNIDQGLSDRLDARLSMFYANSVNGVAAEGPGSPFFTLTFLEPDVDILAKNDDGSPYRAFIPDRRSNASNPLYELANRKIQTNRSRFTGSGLMRWRLPGDWLTAEASYNYDQENQRFSDEVPFGFLTNTNQVTDGNLVRSDFTGQTYNINTTVTSVRQFGRITNTTKLAYIYEDQQFRSLASSSGTFLVAGVPEFSGTEPSSQRASSSTETIRNQNFYGVTTFDINDRYILDGLVRRDGSSLFGPEQRWQTYYRVSGAWRANEDLRISGIDELRLRASYGTAGLRPCFACQYQILTPSAGSFIKTQLGNPRLKPARSTEIEVGANLEWGGGRWQLEYTYAEKDTKDQILLVDLPGVVGFAQQWQNTGRLKAKTHELSLGVQLANTRDMAWTLNVVGDRTRQVITEWTQPERLYGFGQMPAAFFIGQGATLGEMRGQKVVRTLGELYTDPAKKALSGPGQRWSADSVVVNEDGYIVRRSTWRTVNERPIAFVDANGSNIVRIGDANPLFNASFNSTFNYKRFAVSTLVDWTYGGNLYNGTRQWPFFDNRDRVYDQRSKPQEERKPQTYYNFFYNGLNAIDYFVETASYAKLKELAVHYTLSNDQLSKIGLAQPPHDHQVLGL